MKIAFVVATVALYLQVVEVYSKPGIPLANTSSSIVKAIQKDSLPIPCTGSCTSAVEQSPSDRILGGESALEDEFPWQVALNNGSAAVYICGGSVIGDKWILTAASCVDNLKSENLKVHYRGLNVDCNSVPQLGAHEIYIYPTWTPGSMENDIALIEVTPAIEDPAFLPVTLAASDDSDHAGETGTIVGWGSETGSGIICSPSQETLKKSAVSIMANDKCRVTYDYISDSHICITTVDGHGFCRGDEGGPLLVNSVQVGIMSFYSPFGCDTGFPQGSTRVSKFRTWIKAVTGISES